ncbi:MAG: phosphatidate cytidylyltransferase [Methylobacter sp.]|nr:phosphatidate cytidylyltransferase [Methylobacter sp.]
MLIQRIITGSILAALLALAVFNLSSAYFSLLLAVVTFVAAWEWCNLIKIDSLAKRGMFFILLAVPMFWIHFWSEFLELSAQALELSVQAVYKSAKSADWIGVSSFLDGWDFPDLRIYSGLLEWLVIPAVLFWIIVMVLIRNTPEGVLKLELKPRNKSLIGWFILITTWMFLSRLRTFYGSEMAMYFFILIWAADIAAYFSGRKYGTTKLAPEISPGKTVAGMYGAMSVGVLCAVVLSLIYGFTWMIAADFVLLSVLAVLISIYGDLFISVVKRQRGVKDSGALLPGHGGILDRIDSILAAAPLFYAGVYLIYRQVS